MSAGQLSFDFAPQPQPGDALTIRPGERFPNRPDMADVGITVAAFYWCCRELRAGRPCPMPLDDRQRAYVARWAP